MQKTIKIPYHTGKIDLHIDEKNLKALVYSHAEEYKAEADEETIVRKALQNPIGSKPLSELVADKKNILLVTSDHTRAMPSKITLPILLEEIRSGNPDAKITILIATGLHRKTTEAEMRSMFGDAIVDNETIAINDAFNDEEFSYVCDLPSGAEFHVNKLAVESDFVITEGFIEPHFFAGFSGGRKSILPGICNAATVNENHSYKAIANKNSITGVLEGNPIHEDMIFAARKVNVQFILNVALNADKKIISAFAGDLIEAHAKGVDFVRNISNSDVTKGDIVITSNGGYPLDQNVYQTPKAIATAEEYAKENAVIIMCAACIDGMGGTNFEKLMQMGTVEEIDAYLSSIPPKETISEMWCTQIYARILKKHKVILVNEYLDRETVERANMIYANDVDDALEMAYELKGRDAEVVVIPDGVAVLAAKE